MSQPSARIAVEAPYRSDVVATPRPRIGWRTETDSPGWIQAAAELEIVGPNGTAAHRIEGRDSHGIEWPFEPLAPREEVAVREGPRADRIATGRMVRTARDFRRCH